MAASTHMCESLEEAQETLKKYEIETNSRFAVYTASKNFGSSSIEKAKQVYWEDRPSVKIGRLEFTGVPFIVVGTKTFDCQFGKDRKIQRKKALKIENDHSSYKKGKKFLLCDTKKLNCGARCVMREVYRFPTYKVTENATGQELKRVAEDLLCRLLAGEDIPHLHNIITCLPAISHHSGHPVGPGEVVPEPIDSQVAQKIKDLVSNGITDPAILKTQLYDHVKAIKHPAPHPGNKRFYPSDKTIRNHIYRARNKKLCNDQSKIIADWVTEIKESGDDFVSCRQKSDGIENISNGALQTHPSVRIKGTETNYVPVQCFDPACHDRAPHMHCPFCMKTETYTDPVILKAHYRVKHVDKGIEFAGLKVLRCCDRCDIVGVIKGEKKFKGAHWHCYKCRNGFNRRDEAIKHYKTHFRNPQTTFQIQIAQDINQSVAQGFESEEATSCIPTDSFSVHQGLTENITTQPGGMSLLTRGFDGMVSMPGVGAVETVGMSDTQTIMIIQDDGHGNLSTMSELCNAQDLSSDQHQSDLTISEDVSDPGEETVEELRQKIARLEKEKAEQQAHIALLNKKIQEQAQEIAAYKLREQGLIEQLQQAQQSIVIPQDRVIENLCNQLETQHKQLIRSQITQLKQSLASASVSQPKMIVINANPLVASHLGQNVNLATFDINNSNPTPVAMALNFKTESSVSDIDANEMHVEINEIREDPESEKEQEGIENENMKDDNFDKSPEEYSSILVHSLPDDLNEENPVIENDGNIINEPPTKRKKQH